MLDGLEPRGRKLRTNVRKHGLMYFACIHVERERKKK